MRIEEIIKWAVDEYLQLLGIRDWSCRCCQYNINTETVELSYLLGETYRFSFIFTEQYQEPEMYYQFDRRMFLFKGRVYRFNEHREIDLMERPDLRSYEEFILYCKDMIAPNQRWLETGF